MLPSQQRQQKPVAKLYNISRLQAKENIDSMMQTIETADTRLYQYGFLVNLSTYLMLLRMIFVLPKL